MKKKLILFVSIAAFAMMSVACGSRKNVNTETSTEQEIEVVDETNETTSESEDGEIVVECCNSEVVTE